MEMIKKCLLSVCDVDSKIIVPEAEIIKDLGFDFFQIKELAMVIEDETGKCVSEEFLNSAATLGDLQRCLQNISVN